MDRVIVEIEHGMVKIYSNKELQVSVMDLDRDDGGDITEMNNELAKEIKSEGLVKSYPDNC